MALFSTCLDVPSGVLRHEPEQGGGLLDRPATDRRCDEVGLAGRAAEVLGSGGHAHDRRLLLQRRRPLGVLAVPAIGAGVGELAEPVADHVLGHVDRDVLLAVVDGDGVADERGEDDGRTRPGLDDLLLVALVHLLDPPLEAELDERPLLDRTGQGLLLPLLAVARADDQSPGRLGSAGAVAHRGLAPGRLGRHPRRGLALATAVRMVAWVHDDAADFRPLAHVAGAAGLAEVLVLVVEVADLADRGHALDADPADLARRQPDLGDVAFLGEELGRGAGGPDDLAALAGDELDVVDRRAERDLRDRQRVPDAGLGVGAGDDDVTDLQAVGQQHVALLAVAIEEQPDPGGAVRVVLDRREASRHADLVALEVDPAVVLLLAAAAVADGEPAGVVPAGAADLRLEQRLVRLVGRDLLEGRAGHLPKAGRGRLVGAKRHRQTPSKNSIFWPAASVTIALRHGVV